MSELEREKFPTAWQTGQEAVDFVPFDHHCSEMGSGLNMHKSRCEERQKDVAQVLCYGGCRSGDSRTGKTRIKITDTVYWEGINTEIVDLVLSGRTNMQIADELKVSRSKVETTIRFARKLEKIGKDFKRGQ